MYTAIRTPVCTPQDSVTLPLFYRSALTLEKLSQGPSSTSRRFPCCRAQVGVQPLTPWQPGPATSTPPSPHRRRSVSGLRSADGEARRCHRRGRPGYVPAGPDGGAQLSGGGFARTPAQHGGSRRRPTGSPHHSIPVCPQPGDRCGDRHRRQRVGNRLGREQRRGDHLPGGILLRAGWDRPCLRLRHLCRRSDQLGRRRRVPPRPDHHLPPQRGIGHHHRARRPGGPRRRRLCCRLLPRGGAKSHR